mgnify:CR=1 FL=1
MKKYLTIALLSVALFNCKKLYSQKINNVLNKFSFQLVDKKINIDEATKDMVGPEGRLK